VKDENKVARRESPLSDTLFPYGRTDPAVDERFRRMDKDRDFIQGLSRDTRMRRVGAQAVEVMVPLPTDPEAKPVPGRVPKAKPLMEFRTEVSGSRSNIA